MSVCVTLLRVATLRLPSFETSGNLVILVERERERERERRERERERGGGGGGGEEERDANEGIC